jgi:hypothetical protein
MAAVVEAAEVAAAAVANQSDSVPTIQETRSVNRWWARR